MIRRALATLVLIASLASPAAACDWGECWSWWEEPIQELDWWWPEPVWEPEPVPQPAVVVPEGLYLVTEVYVADVVSVSGPLTTYSTATASETPGTYARVVDSVGTGGVSAYDGSAFNGRAALGDGRSVAGTYYENFVLSGDGFVPVSVVFFQDDSALAPPPPPPPPAPPVAPPPPVVVIPAAPPLPTPAAAVARVDPIVEPPLSAPAPPAAPPPPPPPTSAAILPPAAPRVPVIRPGVSLTPGGESRSEIEVLRGRAIPLWIGATVDGVNRPAATWRVGSGDHVALGASSGGGSEAFRARWDVVTPSGSAWRVGIEATAMVDGIAQVSFAEISVIVRSPALVR